MKILGLGVPELIIILIVILVIFGPKQLPKLGKAVGQTVKGLKSGMQEVQEAVKEDSDDEPEEPEEPVTVPEEDEAATEIIEEELVDEEGVQEASDEPTRKVKRVVKKKVD